MTGIVKISVSLKKYVVLKGVRMNFCFITFQLFCVFSSIILTISSTTQWGEIIKGSRSTLGQFPSFVYIRKAQRIGHLCGAALISFKHILTSAVCAENLKAAKKAKSWELVAGSLTTKYITPPCQVRSVAGFYLPPDPMPRVTNFAGIAVIFTNEPFDETQDVYPTKLYHNRIAEGSEVTIVGYGPHEDEDNKILMHANLIANRSGCSGETENGTLFCVTSPKGKIVVFPGAGFGAPVYYKTMLVGISVQPFRGVERGVFIQYVNSYYEGIKIILQLNDTSYHRSLQHRSSGKPQSRNIYLSLPFLLFTCFTISKLSTFFKIGINFALCVK